MAFHPPRYEELTEEEVVDRFDQIMKEWNNFLRSENLQYLKRDKDYFVHKRNLYEIIRRCDKRRVYMEMFHDLEPCEYKKLAVECFWINTLKPFMIVNEKCDAYNCPNELFSLYRILSLIESLFKEINPNQQFAYPSPSRIQDIVYDFKYCSLNREAMVAYIETLADTYGIGISYIYKQMENKSK